MRVKTEVVSFLKVDVDSMCRTLDPGYPGA